MNETMIEPRKRTMPEQPAKIKSLGGEFFEDSRRVRASLELSRDDTRPDLDLRLIDAEGIELCHATIIENIGATLIFTLHIRQESIIFPLTLNGRLSYMDGEIQSEKEVSIHNE